MKQLQAFHGDKEIKQKYLNRLQAHAKADEIVRGYYWQNGKGCAIGYTIHSGNHNSYETELGLPEWLARLEDRLFEGMGNGDAKMFPITFLEAIPIGAKDFDKIKWQFCSYLLNENLKRVLQLNISDKLKMQVVDAMRKVLTVHTKALNDGIWDESAAESAESAARSAEWSVARSAAKSAAYKRYADKLIKLLQKMK